MRNRFLFLGLSASLAAGAAAFLACSGSTESTASEDAGADVFDSGPRETGADGKDSAPPCDPTADFVKKIPDASIADGASTSGVCAGCIEARCKKELDRCNQDCACQALAQTGLACYMQNSGKPAACVAPFVSAPSTTRNIALGLVGCLSESCKTECAVDAFIGDAGDAGDAADARDD